MSSWLTDRQLLNLMDQMRPIAEGKDEQADGERPYQAMLEVRGGQIHVQATGMQGELPRIEALPPLAILINGQAVAGCVEVNPEDKVEWRSEQKLYRVDIAADKMKAWLTVHPDGEFAIKPADHGLTSMLVLQPEEDTGAPLMLPESADIDAHVRGLSIQANYMHAALGEIRELSGLPILIAKGQEPAAGRDARLEIFFKEQIESSFEEVNGTIDFRNHLKIPSVKKGEMIARKVPAENGVNGHDIFGQVIEAPKPRDIVLIGRKYVTITANHEVYALKEGRPRIMGDIIKFIDITTTHVIPGDVDMSTGNIVFSGDIIIYGSVKDGMIIEALGDVYVMGSVFRSTITATGSIRIIGNSVGCHLYSGHYGVLFNRLFNFSMRLIDELKSLVHQTDQLIQSAMARGHRVSERQIYRMLLENRFRTVPDLAKELLQCIVNIQNIRNGDLEGLRDSLSRLLSPNEMNRLEDRRFIFDLLGLLTDTVEAVRSSEESNVITDIQQCQMTNIMSNGDIVIRQKGVLQSTLYSKGNIVFRDAEGVCRGSRIEAGDTIHAALVGGKSGGSSSLTAGRNITAAFIFEAKITVGRFSKEIMEPVENVSFYVANNRLATGPATGREGEYHLVAN